MTAGTTGYSPEFVKQQEENMTNSLLYDLFHQAYASAPHGDAPKDAIFEAEAAEMKKLAKAGHCVILGRCADYILRDHPNCLRVYLHAPLSARVQRVAQLEPKTLEWAREKVRREDQHRNAYYQLLHRAEKRPGGSVSPVHQYPVRGSVCTAGCFAGIISQYAASEQR